MKEKTKHVPAIMLWSFCWVSLELSFLYKAITFSFSASFPFYIRHLLSPPFPSLFPSLPSFAYSQVKVVHELDADTAVRVSTQSGLGHLEVRCDSGGNSVKCCSPSLPFSFSLTSQRAVQLFAFVLH